MRFRHPLLAAGILAALGLAGCTVGPNYQRPAAPTATRYAPTPVPRRTAAAPVAGGTAQRFVTGMDVSGQWWRAFGSAPLDRLVADALKRNPDLAAAQAALQQAREDVAAQRGGYWPQIGVGLNPTRQKTGSVLSSGIASNSSLYTLTTAQVSVGFTPDLWGGNRRAVESLVAQADAQRFQLEATYLTLIANVANSAIGEASLRAQIAATKAIIDEQSRIVASWHRQLALGQVAESDLLAQQALLAQDRAALPPLQKQLAQQLDLLRDLNGRAPDDALGAPFTMAGLHLPAQLPLSLPARLVEQRPDVRMAEAVLHAACAQVGVAIANRLPDIGIDASLGSASEVTHDLFAAGGGFWSLGADVTQPLFDGGVLKHRQRAAEANYRQALAQYRSVVLAALQNVADTLHAVTYDATALQAAANSEQAAARSLAIARRQQALGDLSADDVLNAELAWRQARLALVQAQAARYADTVALFQALGGGWWHRHDVALAGSEQ